MKPVVAFIRPSSAFFRPSSRSLGAEEREPKRNFDGVIYDLVCKGIAGKSDLFHGSRRLRNWPRFCDPGSEDPGGIVGDVFSKWLSRIMRPRRDAGSFILGEYKF